MSCQTTVIQLSPTTTLVYQPGLAQTIQQGAAGGVVRVQPAVTQLLAPAVAPPPSVTQDVTSTTLVQANGPPGVGESDGTAVTRSYVNNDAATLYAGMPVCLVSGMLRRAAPWAPFNECIGLVYDPVIPVGGAGRVQLFGSMPLTTLQWDTAAGMVGGLASEQPYFVGGVGAISPYPPTEGGQYLVPIGYAASNVELIIELGTQILL